MADKSEFRQAVKERLVRMNDRDRSAQSRSVCKRLLEYLDDKPTIIAGYLPLSDEPNIRPFLMECLDKQWITCLPAEENQKLVFRITHDLNETVRGKLGIDEPPQDAPEVDYEKLDVVLVPGRAYGKDGTRMGRGNGGYDRWIEKQRMRNHRTQYIGVCFDEQLFQAVPVEAHDQKMDIVITPRGIHTI